MAVQGGAVKNLKKKKATHSERVCKLVLVGDMSVGKTCLVLRFIKGVFYDSPGATLGVAFSTQTVDLEDGRVQFEIWDTAGQEQFRSLIPMYYRGAQAAIVVYDITNNESYLRATSWVQELQRCAKPNIVIALAGNKADLVGDRNLDFDVAQLYANENGLLFMETSAKTGMNVEDIFLTIAKKLPKSVSGSQRHGGLGNLRVSGQDQSSHDGGCCKT